MRELIVFGRGGGVRFRKVLAKASGGGPDRPNRAPRWRAGRLKFLGRLNGTEARNPATLPFLPTPRRCARRCRAGWLVAALFGPTPPTCGRTSRNEAAPPCQAPARAPRSDGR